MPNARSPFSTALLSIVLISVIVPGCRKSSEPAPSGNHASSAPATPPKTDTWLGRWTGPEGTYLQIAGGGGSYEVTVKDLDAARTFQGSAAGDRIEFERDGAKESLRATNGDETGMKWLAGKTNCLTVKPGEGYCRD